MHEVLSQLRQICQRVNVPERFERSRTLQSMNPEAECVGLMALTTFRTTLTCYSELAEKRHQLTPERRHTLEQILADAPLQAQLAGLLAEMHPLELPEDLLHCVLQHGPLRTELVQRLDALLEGPE